MTESQIPQANRRYTIWKALPLSFYSEALYRDVALRWKGSGFLYLLLLSALLYIPLAILMHHNVSVFLAEEGPTIAEQIPVIEIENGKASLQNSLLNKAEESINITASTGETVAIINIDSHAPIPDDFRYGIIFTPTHIIIRDGSWDQEFPLQDIQNLTITPEFVLTLMDKIGTAMISIFIPITILSSAVMRLIQAAIFSIATMFWAQTRGTQLTFANAIRLTSVAMTPAIVIDAYAAAFLVYPGFVVFTVSLAYVYFATRVISQGKLPKKGR